MEMPGLQQLSTDPDRRQNSSSTDNISISVRENVTKVLLRTSATAERTGAAQKGFVLMTIRSITISTRRISSWLSVLRMTDCQALKKEDFHPYHLQRTQHLSLEEYE